MTLLRSTAAWLSRREIRCICPSAARSPFRFWSILLGAARDEFHGLRSRTDRHPHGALVPQIVGGSRERIHMVDPAEQRDGFQADAVFQVDEVRARPSCRTRRSRRCAIPAYPNRALPIPSGWEGRSGGRSWPSEGLRRFDHRGGRWSGNRPTETRWLRSPHCRLRGLCEDPFTEVASTKAVPRSCGSPLNGSPSPAESFTRPLVSENRDAMELREELVSAEAAAEPAGSHGRSATPTSRNRSSARLRGS